MNTIIIFSSEALFDFLSHIFKDFPQPLLIDIYQNGCFVIHDDDLIFQQKGRTVRANDFSYSFFFPDGIDSFISFPFGAQSSSELSARSGVSLALTLLHELSQNGPSRPTIIGNIATSCIMSANRGAFFRLRAHHFTHDYAIVHKASPSLLPHFLLTPSLFRFLPDTHIWIDDQVTAPLPLDHDLYNSLARLDFGFCIEQYYKLAFDLRVFVFGEHIFAVCWKRSIEPNVIDVRIAKDNLDSFIFTPIPTHILSFIKDVGIHFGICLYCVDFVTDLKDIFFPTDLNISPTWDWLEPNISHQVTSVFSQFLAGLLTPLP